MLHRPCLRTSRLQRATAASAGAIVVDVDYGAVLASARSSNALAWIRAPRTLIGGFSDAIQAVQARELFCDAFKARLLGCPIDALR